MMLTHKRLLELVHYDPETGVFTRKVATSNNVHVGDTIGSLYPNGYLYCRFSKKHYYLHRLAVFYVTRRWPIGLVDHRNRNKADNRWANLREATQPQNQANSEVARSNTGYRGVHRMPPRKDGSPRYVAHTVVNGVNTHLGIFDTAKKAYAAYVAAVRAQHGEFAEHL